LGINGVDGINGINGGGVIFGINGINGVDGINGGGRLRPPWGVSLGGWRFGCIFANKI
jgi:hypothetical protein